MDPISASSGAFALFKKLQDLGKKLNNAELSNMIADLQIQMADLKMENADLKNLVVELRSQVEAKKVKVALGDGGYYTEDDGAFCVPCYDSKNQLHRLKYHPPSGSFQCSICNKSSGPDTYKSDRRLKTS